MKKILDTIKSLAGKTIIDPKKERIKKEKRVWNNKNKKFYEQQSTKNEM